ncbi:hypothetical protein ABPG75_008741 [Micractinium tetrahymenae]
MSGGSSEVSEDYSHYSDWEGSDVSVQSTLAELLERFTIDAKPECTIKLRGRAGPLVVGADLTHVTGTKSNVGALVIKPSRPDRWWRRLRVDNSGTLMLRSRKLHWWLFTLDVIGHANPLTRTFDLSYRVATKWDVARGEYRNKKRFELGEEAEARAHWTISYSLPAIEGSMGTAAQRSMSREVHADVGCAHLSIPRVELVVWPRQLGGRPEHKGGSGTAAEEHADSQEQDGGGGASGGDGGSGVSADLDVAAAWEGADTASSGAVSAVAGTANSPAISELQQQPHLYHQRHWQQQEQQEQEHWRRQQQQWHDLPARQVLADGGSWQQGGPTSRHSRQASLQLLNSHVASISGRWWDAYGARAGGGSITAGWKRR